MVALTVEEPTSRAAGTLALSPQDAKRVQQFERLLDLIRDRTEQASRRHHNGVLVFGRAGTGKTRTVTDTLNTLTLPWHLWNARMSPMGLHCVMQENAEAVIVIDDLATLFGTSNKAALQVLLAGLGGEPGEPRQVTYATAKDRVSFWFKGSIILIANQLPKRDAIVDALISRVCLLEHEPSDETIAAFMQAPALKGYKSETLTEPNEIKPAEALGVVNYVIAEAQDTEYRLDLRYMTAGWQDYLFWLSGKSRHHWQTLVKSSMKKIVDNDRLVPTTRAERKEWEQQVALDLFRRFPQPEDKDQRDKEWAELTKKGPDSLYRRRRELEGSGRL